MAINNAAPIIPSGGAATIIIGEMVELVLERATEAFTSEPIVVSGVTAPGSMRYRSSYVDFWTQDGIVYQVMVHDNYAGKFLGKIGLGSTLADVEKAFGPIKAILDSLVVKGLPGIAFEPKDDDDINSPIYEIYVWKPDWAEIYEHQSDDTYHWFSHQ